MELLPNSLSFRMITTLETTPDTPVPPRFSGRVRASWQGRLVSVSWYSSGELDDPNHRVAAYTSYRPSGRVKQERHYRSDRLHDPAPGRPAVVGYFDDGSVRYREHFRYGRRHDAEAVPAIRKWRADGSLKTEHHYYEGLRIEMIESARAG